MKRFFCGLMAALTLLLTLAALALAVDESRSFDFSLTADGGSEKRAAAGDIVTVTLTLRRSDAAEEYDMYAVQDEILYDNTFFELVPDSAMTASAGVVTGDHDRGDGLRAFYMNFVSLSGGEAWKAGTVVGSFQLRVIGTAGASVIRNSSYKVSTQDGQDSYAATAQDLTVSVSDDCIVRFESNGGSEVPDQCVLLGGKVKRPDDPGKEGFWLEGWYSDRELLDEWDFDEDTVSGNMTLYAKWTTEAPARTINWQRIVPAVLLLVILLLVVIGRKNAYRRSADASENSKAAEDKKKEEQDE